MTHAFLADRSFIEIGGTDAEHFLQNLITTDLSTLAANEAAPGALLTPQGKVMFFFLISRHGTGFRLETESEFRDNLLKRLTLYRLRAAVEFSGWSEDGVSVFWNEEAEGAMDQRFAKAGISLVRLPGRAAEAGSEREAYDALRIMHGIAETAVDHASGDAFPHDVLMDLSGGLSFRKGCYVGQEVVSRMQHRGTARRRLVELKADGVLPEGETQVTVDGKSIGTLATRVSTGALAVVRIDKAGEAIANGRPILVGEMPVRLSLPAWSGLSFPTTSAGDDA